jgi:hypothetical protein
MVGQLLDILIAPVMLRPCNVGVGQLVDNREFRVARDDPVNVHFFNGYATIRDLLQWDALEISHAGGRFGPTMRLDEPEDYIMSFRTELVRLFERSIGLADTGGAAEVDFELPVLCLGEKIQELLGIARIVIVLHRAAAVPGLE